MTSAKKTLWLDGVELVRRFLLHVLPKGFMRIRHYGFLANRCRAQRLPAIHEAIAAAWAASHPPDELLDEAAPGTAAAVCPHCRQPALITVYQPPPERLDAR